MALLALVAAAGRRGVNRERVVGVLWPETGEDQARHTLSQTLYSLKRETGREWIVAGTDLRLDAGLSSDIGAFHDALTAGDFQLAADLYVGPFLDGFYLPGAPEFERWVDDERARLHRSAIGALEQLVVRADHVGDHPAAIRAWTRLTELDPLNARYASGLMRALAAAGDRASALMHARRHEADVRRELETDVDLAVRDLTASLRSSHRAPNVSPSAPPSIAAPTPGTAASDAVPSATRRNNWPVLLVAAVAVIAVAAVMLGSRDRQTAPFLAVGTIRTPELADSSALGLVLRDMLATTLGGLDGVQVVANSRLVELTPPALADEPTATADAARRAGASEVIEGELATVSGMMVLTLRRVDLSRGVVRKGYRVQAANRYALVDSAAAALASDLGLAPPSLTVRDVRTASHEAYLLYTEGLRSYYSFDSPGAYRLMNAALQRDSTFAMAAFYAWQIGEHLAPDAATRRREFDRVKQLATHTIERERLLIQTEVARREAPLAVAAALAETLVVRYPTDPDGHIALGVVRMGQGDFAGSVAAYRLAFLIDSTAKSSGPFCRMCLAVDGMNNSYLWWDSASAAERVSRQLIALRSDEPIHWSGLVEPLLRQGRRDEAEAALARSGAMSLGPTLGIGILHRDLIRWGQFDQVDAPLVADVQSPRQETRNDAHWLLMISLRDQGRLREALALGREGKIPGMAAVVRGAVPEPILTATLLEGLGQPDIAAQLLHIEARRVMALKELPPGQLYRNAAWYLTLAGSAYAAAGDTLSLRRLADSVEMLGRASSFGRDLVIHHYLRGLLHQRNARHPDAVDAFRRALFSPTDGYTRINLALARSLIALQRSDEAIAVLRPAIRGGVDGSNSYTSRAELHEAIAEAFERAGERDSARAHFGAVERAWRNADPEFAGRYRRAKAALSQ